MDTPYFIQMALGYILIFGSLFYLDLYRNDKLTNFGKVAYLEVSGFLFGIMVGIAIVLPEKSHVVWVIFVATVFFCVLYIHLAVHGGEEYLGKQFRSLKRKLIK